LNRGTAHLFISTHVVSLPASTIWEWEIGRAPLAGEPDDLQPMHQTHAGRPQGVQDGRRHARWTVEADVRPRAFQGPVSRLSVGEPAGVISSPRTFFSDIWNRYSNSLSMALLMNSEMELMPHSGCATSLFSIATPNALSILIVTRSSRAFCPVCAISPNSHPIKRDNKCRETYHCIYSFAVTSRYT